jgi:hypothetical protein
VAKGRRTLDGQIVLEGTWLHAGTTRSRIVILRRDKWYGTGDREDPPEVSDDREIETFEVRYDAAADTRRFAAGGGQYLTLDSARAGAEAACGPSVVWKSDS